MFKLLRQITSSVIYPRSDRSWTDDDAKPNVPTIGRKRKMSDEDEDSQESGSTRKRRGQLERQDTSELSELGVKGSGTDPGVKQVTHGVKEVELEDTKGTIEETSETPDGEASVARPIDPAAAPQDDDSLSPSQEATVIDDKVSVDQSEAINVAPSNDPTGDEPTDEEEPSTTNSDLEESLIEPQEEKDSVGAVPEVGSDEVADAKESDGSSPEP